MEKAMDSRIVLCVTCNFNSMQYGEKNNRSRQ